MAINLTTVFKPYTDELFSTESKKALLTNNDFDWTGAHTVKVYKIGTSKMTDYDRAGTNVGVTTGEAGTVVWSRYGAVASLDATTEEFTLKKDRSFTFAIDKLDTDETAQQLEAASALARQQREVVIPEVDSYVYNVMATGAGTKPAAVTLTETNIYSEILKATEALDRWLRSTRKRPSACSISQRLFADEAEPGYYNGNGDRERYALEGRNFQCGRSGGCAYSFCPSPGRFWLHAVPSVCVRGSYEAGRL